MNLIEYRGKVDKLLAKARLHRARFAECKRDLKAATTHHEATEEAREIIQNVASEIQEAAHKNIAAIVSRCLSAIFDEPYTFKIHFERKRGKTEARLAFERGTVEVDPMTASGGGVVDVAAFALRLACLVLSKPALTRLIVLDEPFKFLSVQYRDRVRELMEGLSRDLGVQFIMVTHLEDLETGLVLDL